ncbi:Transcription factor LHW [Heracleum sosnowskyi]|uniref:Transcription factor LHW n=1 Tax=Heracleum sosnowskyi TaxID=360622 RepID=A0AAD8JA15_9APIA|nr:Transcription factor LHW [Heracleum sosnowskyi]
MGYLLKEALKTLCGVNQWSYAVFWKIGCQNPKLLIWEECYYGPITYSGLPSVPGVENSRFTFHDLQAGLVSPEAYNSPGFQGDDRVHLLVNNMMLDNHVNVVGEGLVGRAAFTGNYHWILSQNCTKEFHPPEVLNAMRQQISAGMQTVVVIPVLPHGVVQLGSSSAIIENMQIVNDVKTLILQLGYIPGVLFSDKFAATEPSSGTEAVVLENSASMNSSAKSRFMASYFTDNYKQQNDSPALSVVGQTSSSLIRQIQDNLHSTGQNFNRQLTVVSSAHPQAQVIADRKPIIDQRNQLDNRISGAESMNSDAELWRNEAPFYLPESVVNQQHSFAPLATVSGSRSLEEKLLVDFDVDSGNLNVSDAFLLKWMRKCLSSSPHEGSGNDQPHKSSNPHNVLSGLSEISNVSSLSSVHGFTKGYTESEFQNDSQYKPQLSTLSIAKQLAPNHLSPSNSRIRHEFEDKTCTQVDLDKEMACNSCSFNNEPYKEESEVFSQSKPFYGSQSSSWVEQGPEKKQSTSSAAFTKKSDEISKSNRKRCKPGENPRPRPKDRQMIQDRVKELREIVPNSAKCSIDALLERTIKHMLFLQSVTKHADKLKQTGESKIMNKEGGLLLKDNSEGGATWAYEVGSQSMVCPIIVEDLNSPRQMLVEMLCEEQGLFLEIADIVRGLGLTILKGVMETRNNKIWARFAVEANRDVTRMEIFLSLVRLLGHTVQSSAVAVNCVGNDGAMAYQPLHPGVSIASTGHFHVLIQNHCNITSSNPKVMGSVPHIHFHFFRHFCNYMIIKDILEISQAVFGSQGAVLPTDGIIR